MDFSVIIFDFSSERRRGESGGGSKNERVFQSAWLSPLNKIRLIICCLLTVVSYFFFIFHNLFNYSRIKYFLWIKILDVWASGVFIVFGIKND